MTYNYKISPIDKPNDAILWSIEFDNDQKPVVHSVKRRDLVKEKTRDKRRFVHEKFFFEILKTVIVVIVKYFHDNKGERREKKGKFKNSFYSKWQES